MYDGAEELKQNVLGKITFLKKQKWITDNNTQNF